MSVIATLINGVYSWDGADEGRHRNTEGLSELGKRVINECLNAYVDRYGQVFDPCHIWFGEKLDPNSWSIK